eukprot:scaffold32169_cov50-Phaeocystis_antarctica.AAC.1
MCIPLYRKVPLSLVRIRACRSQVSAQSAYIVPRQRHGDTAAEHRQRPDDQREPRDRAAECGADGEVVAQPQVDERGQHEGERHRAEHPDEGYEVVELARAPPPDRGPSQVARRRGERCFYHVSDRHHLQGEGADHREGVAEAQHGAGGGGGVHVERNGHNGVLAEACVA